MKQAREIKIDSQHVTKLLREKHWNSVFISQCKNGPTWGYLGSKGWLLILDAWVMKKSWAHPLTIGYEIKINRSDFLADDKWSRYLDYCNEFYFVCPPGLILLNEIPLEVGLYYVTKSGKSLRSQRKAVYRDIEIPEEFYRYILMCRTRII